MSLDQLDRVSHLDSVLLVVEIWKEVSLDQLDRVSHLDSVLLVVEIWKENCKLKRVS